jgi:hypothetical protein
MAMNFPFTSKGEETVSKSNVENKTRLYEQTFLQIIRSFENLEIKLLNMKIQVL